MARGFYKGSSNNTGPRIRRGSRRNSFQYAKSKRNRRSYLAKDRAANCHPPIVDGSDSDRSDSDSDDDYDENKPTISDSSRRHAI